MPRPEPTSACAWTRPTRGASARPIGVIGGWLEPTHSWRRADEPRRSVRGAGQLTPRVDHRGGWNFCDRLDAGIRTEIDYRLAERAAAAPLLRAVFAAVHEHERATHRRSQMGRP